MAGLILSNRRNGRDPFSLARELFSFEPFAPRFDAKAGGFVPKFNVVESEIAYVIEADLPGVKDADLSITLKDRILEIGGKREASETSESDNVHIVERRFGSFSRTFKLPDKAAADGVTADLREGVLTVTVPKRPELAPKSIEIKTS